MGRLTEATLDGADEWKLTVAVLAPLLLCVATIIVLAVSRPLSGAWVEFVMPRLWGE